MNTGLKVVGFLAAVLAIFGIALGVGNAIGPIGSEPATHDADHSGDDSEDSHNSPGAEGETTPATDIPGGLMVHGAEGTLRGYQVRSRLRPGVPT